MIISGVAATVQSLVYVDAFIPENDQSALELLPPTIVARLRKIANEQGAGWRLPGGDAQLDLTGLAPFAAKARAAGWSVTDIDSGHDCHVEKPIEVAGVLLKLAG